MKKLVAVVIVILVIGTVQAAAAPLLAGIPTFEIIGVTPDADVTIKTTNFPAGDTFTVTMGPYGSLGIGGTVVGTQDSGAGSSFTATYTIPASLHGSTRIHLRLQSPTSGYYSYNWFVNNAVSLTPAPLPPVLIPVFDIQDVNADTDVTIKTSNFPAGDTFTVTMGPYGSLGIGGTVVGTQDSGAGGSFTATYTIPTGLHGSTRIHLRLQSPTSGYYSYNWFNNTAGGAPPPAITFLPPGVIPTFTITAVAKDDTVTIQGINFTKNDTYTVRIGAYGTLGVGGTVVDSQATGASGSFTATYDIPAALHGASKLSIRLESDTTPYYSYNWFYNSTLP